MLVVFWTRYVDGISTSCLVFLEEKVPACATGELIGHVVPIPNV